MKVIDTPAWMGELEGRTTHTYYRNPDISCIWYLQCVFEQATKSRPVTIFKIGSINDKRISPNITLRHLV
jgi:hypothetical protein